jgi:integral membrane protein (TIGR01906 family)
MRRAPWPVSLLFGASIGLLILLAGPLLLFNPWFVSTLQERHDVAEAFGTSRAEIDRVTEELLLDIFAGGDFDAALEGRPLLDEAERSHMADVSRLVRLLVITVGASMIIAGLCGALLRAQPRRMANVLVATASAIGAAGLVLGLAFAVAFEPTFLAFHAVFFPPGTYLFAPGSDLITLFPGGFWFEASLIAGATVVLSALAVLAIGLSGRRRPPTTLAAA